MIPKPILVAWRKHADWPTDDQVEQDLIISAALVKIFNNKFLEGKLAFRGGTAINKLIFPKALRYSEDIDLNRLETGKAGPAFDAIRESLKDIFPEKAKSERTDMSVKLIYSYPSSSGGTSNLKVEINVRETLPQEEVIKMPYEVESDFFTGKTNIVAFNKEEMIGTKLRALYQRNKGRDLFDLYELGKMNFNWEKTVASFHKLKIGATRAEFEKNLEEKMKNTEFLEDMARLLPNGVIYDVQDAYKWFKREVLPKM